MDFMVYLTLLSLFSDYIVPIGRMISELQRLWLSPNWDDVLAFASLE
jgi:hypothetical protein